MCISKCIKSITLFFSGGKYKQNINAAKRIYKSFRHSYALGIAFVFSIFSEIASPP